VLHGIAEAAAEKGETASGDERVIGEFFAACTDTASIDAAGAKPIEDTMRRIAAITTLAGVQREIAWLARRGISVPVRLFPLAGYCP
jgi:putative endopeptidase